MPRRSLAAAALALLAAGCQDAAPTPLAPGDAPLAAKGGNAKEADAYVLPGTRVFPEGIAVDQRRQRVYVTSTTSGAILYGRLGDDSLADSIPGGPGGRTTAIGLDVTSEGDLVVAGGATGRIFVLSPDGATLASLDAAKGATTFVNDVAVARGDTAYVTDSQNPVIYRVYEGAGGWVVEPWLPLAGTPIVYQAGFNLNGIAVSPDSRTLYVVQSNTGRLFAIDVATKVVTPIDLGGVALTNGDGLEVTAGNRLTVLRNQEELLVEVRLRDGGRTGEVVSQRTDASFRYPTTFVEARGRYLVVNSQFDARNAGTPPVLPFTVSVVKKN